MGDGIAGKSCGETRALVSATPLSPNRSRLGTSSATHQPCRPHFPPGFPMLVSTLIIPVKWSGATLIRIHGTRYEQQINGSQPQTSIYLFRQSEADCPIQYKYIIHSQSEPQMLTMTCFDLSKQPNPQEEIYIPC